MTTPPLQVVKEILDEAKRLLEEGANTGRVFELVDEAQELILHLLEKP